MKATTEKAFEAYIHETMTANGWLAGSNKSWDKQKALFPEYVTAFIKDTQPTHGAQMEKLLGPELPERVRARPDHSLSQFKCFNCLSHL